jgi:hypothetical protein
VLADFGPPLATVIMSLVPPMLFPEIPLPKLAVPASISTTSGRPWLVPLFSIPPWAIFAAAIPAILVTVLIFLDQVGGSYSQPAGGACTRVISFKEFFADY